MTVNNLDPLFRDILGIDEPSEDGAIGGESTTDAELDPVGAFRFREEFKIDPPNSKAAPQSIAEISKSLDGVRRAIGGENPFASRLQKLNVSFSSMAASSEEYLGADSAVTQFFQGAASRNDGAMRKALRRMHDEDATAN